ncbi:MAG TPA: hypothetical protein VHL54_03900 [Actinomycetota bacterium]|nr:hypothetical protein [Actinomycetota bacterium]
MRSVLLSSVICAALILPAAASAQNGTADFDPDINWEHSPPLYFTVTGGPPNTCGALWTKRNGNPYTGTGIGWLCTDANGYALKGPWYYSSQQGSEIAYAYIKWPDNTVTTTAKHVWDKNAPVVSVSTSGPPPYYSFMGTASDAWGAGFSSSWSLCRMTFLDVDTGKYWKPGRSAYDQTYAEVPCTLTGMPSASVIWSAGSSVPPPSAHAAPHCYIWETGVYDGGKWGYGDKLFCLF